MRAACWGETYDMPLHAACEDQGLPSGGGAHCPATATPRFPSESTSSKNMITPP